MCILCVEVTLCHTGESHQRQRLQNASICLWTKLCCSPQWPPTAVTFSVVPTFSSIQEEGRTTVPDDSFLDCYLKRIKWAQGHRVCEGAGAMLCVQCWWGQKRVSYALEFELQMVVRWWWKPNPGPLKCSKQVLVTTEPSFPPPNSSSGRLHSLLSSNRSSHLSEVGGSAELSWLFQYYTVPTQTPTGHSIHSS